MYLLLFSHSFLGSENWQNQMIIIWFWTIGKSSLPLLMQLVLGKLAYVLSKHFNKHLHAISNNFVVFSNNPMHKNYILLWIIHYCPITSKYLRECTYRQIDQQSKDCFPFYRFHNVSSSYRLHTHTHTHTHKQTRFLTLQIIFNLFRKFFLLSSTLKGFLLSRRSH